MKLNKILAILLLFFSGFSEKSQADEKKQLRKSTQSNIQVDGTFKVSAIETMKFPGRDTEYKRIYFQELATDKKKLQIYLDSISVHPALRVGASFELSAEINPKDRAKKAKEALQILLFIPQNGRKISVWLLSLKNKDLDLRGAKYFKMHNPDFIIL